MASAAASSPNIAIIGAGPAGLCLARILLQSGIRATIFEGDKSPEARGQGGSLDLHPGTGQAALKEAGIFDQFQKYARYEDEYLRLTNQYNEIIVEIAEGVETNRPEIDRLRLRQILLESIPADMIKWGHHLSKAEVGKLYFRDGSVADGFDLIVGADGAWSHVRDLLTPIKPFYSGIMGVEISLKDIDNAAPGLKSMLGKGAYWSWSDEVGQALMSLKLGDGSSHIYAFQRVPESWVKDSGIDFQDPASVRAGLLRDFADWSEPHKDWIRAITTPSPSRPLYMLPPGLRWPHRAGVTVIGDAAHVMTPFAGEGVNAALNDAMHLANSIIAHRDDLWKAVVEYEDWMFPAAKDVTERTYESLLDRFDRGGLEKFKRLLSDSEPTWDYVKRTI